MVARSELHICLWAQKLKYLKSEIIQILQSLYQRYADAHI